MSDHEPLTFLCLASHEKGAEFLRELKRQGCRVYLVTSEKERNEPWPMEVIDERFLLPTLHNRLDLTHAVSYLARHHRLDRLAALDDLDVELAAALREHLRLPGMGETSARYFRDKLAMRLRAREVGLRVPEFTPVLHYDTLRAWMACVPPPWVLKPRGEASSVGIRTLHEAEHFWRALDELGDRQSHFVLEQFIPGTVFHVDGLVWDQQLCFAEVHRYARPPLNVMQGGGVFCSQSVARGSAPSAQLRQLTGQMIAGLGLQRGATHTEFIQSESDGEFYFLETAARVGGAYIAEMVEAATGINLWREWARLEVAAACGEPYSPPPARHDYAGVLISLARQAWPDTSGYDEPEIVWRLAKAQHVGLIVASPDAARVAALLDDYQQRFARDFSMTLPPQETLYDE